MMKRFLASLLGVVIFFLLLPTSTILIARDMSDEKTIGKLIETVPEVFGDEFAGEGLAEGLLEEIEEYDPRYADCFDEEEVEKLIAKLFSEAIENLGDPDAEYIVDTEELVDYVVKATEEYAEEIGEELPEDFEEQLKAKLGDMEEFRRDVFFDDPELEGIAVLFEAVYSNKVLITLIAGIVLCVILMFILLKDISLTLLKVKTPFMVNGICILLLSFGFQSLLNSTEINGGAELPSEFISILTSPFYKVGAISLVIAIALIIIAKVLKHNKSISNSNAALENLGNVNYNPNTNITNTPYNGYQNH